MSLIQDDEKPVAVDVIKLKQAKPRDYAIRFGFWAAISVIAALISMKFGPKVGGLFLAFPAILPATLTLLEKKEGKTMAVAAAILALGAALLAWTAVALGLYFVFRDTNLYEREDRLLRKTK